MDVLMKDDHAVRPIHIRKECRNRGIVRGRRLRLDSYTCVRSTQFPATWKAQ